MTASRASSIPQIDTDADDSVTPTNERTPRNLSVTQINHLTASKESEISSLSKSEEEYYTAQSNFTSLSDFSSSKC